MDFFWQEGYSAFTVSATARKAVFGFMAGQEEYLRVKTFRDELIELLTLAGIEFDPKYMD